MAGLFEIPVAEVDFRAYKNVHVLAKEIADWVKKTHFAATLDLEHKWWAQGVVSPNIGLYVNISKGYKGISEEELIAALKEEDLYYTPIFGKTGIGFVATTYMRYFPV